MSRGRQKKLGYQFYRKIIDTYKRNNPGISEKGARMWYRENEVGKYFRMDKSKIKGKIAKEFRRILIELGWKKRSDRTNPGNTPKGA